MKDSEKKRLLSLEWNDFGKYPDQGSDIILHAYGKNLMNGLMVHRFIRVGAFNAVTFNVGRIEKKLKESVKWIFAWIEADKADGMMSN